MDWQSDAWPADRDLDAHPAAVAWRATGGDRLARIEYVRGNLERGKGRAIFRLFRSGSAGDTIIAKCRKSGPGERERIAYERVLPLLSVPVPRCYGAHDDGSRVWLFVEDARSERITLESPEHRACAARWLARMHVEAAALPCSWLPERGAAYYLGVLQQVRTAILDNLQNPAFRSDDVAVLQAVLARTAFLQSVWDRVERLCAAMPRTLVHGDFAAKNVFVRAEPAGLELFVIDWEKIGWGVPAIDLSSLAREPAQQIEPSIYADAARLPPGEVAEWAVAGSIFRMLLAMEWSSQSLAFRWPAKPVGNLQLYLREMERALACASWAS
ncbi:MAG TPA: phosphotransferase [Planctomycetota bacterium]